MRVQSTREPSQRQLRVGEQLRHIIAETIQRGHFHDAALLDASGITVSEVRVSPDLKNATAYVSVLGNMSIEEILPALNNAAKAFQKEIGRNSSMKFTPRLQFRADESFGKADRIEEILRDIHKTTNIDSNKDG